MPPTSVLEDPFLMGLLKWSEIEDLLCLKVFQYTRRDPLSRHGLLNIDSMDRGQFRTYFRFERDDVRSLCRALQVPENVTTPQGVHVSGVEALCLTLRRLAYPNRLRELEPLFGRHYSVISSATNALLAHIDSTFEHLLRDVNNHTWLDTAKLRLFSEAVHSKGAPLHNCWGFIDGTARAICRPSKDQKRFFSGHKRFHALKYQSIMCPNGIICQLNGPYVGSRHDAGILRKSNTYRKLEKLAKGHSFCLYGDPAYPLRPLLLKPYGGNVTVQQRAFNKRMSSVRQAVEWGFGKIAGLFAFLDFRKNQRLKRQNVSRMYKVGTILANCHTCMYSSQVSQHFQVEPPQLEEYLRPKN
ncbi:uncharacterized protein LOC142817905 [Rhipicephalus microplus]|uniref:uncharacterized protein LOC142817905 n=1 Tax=Rhipicephalus microplus TaxID=6941 RepID=UPI003F6B7AE7